VVIDIIYPFCVMSCLCFCFILITTYVFAKQCMIHGLMYVCVLGCSVEEKYSADIADPCDGCTCGGVEE